MQKVTVTTVDDMDGATAAEKHSIQVDGYEIEIDLGLPNWDRLAQALAPFFAAGRRVSNGVTKAPHPALTAAPLPSSSPAPPTKALPAKAVKALSAPTGGTGDLSPTRVAPALLGSGAAIKTHPKGQECGRGDVHAGACTPVVVPEAKKGPLGQRRSVPAPHHSFSYRAAWDYWAAHPELAAAHPEVVVHDRRPPNVVRDAYLASLSGSSNGNGNGRAVHVPTFKAPEGDDDTSEDGQGGAASPPASLPPAPPATHRTNLAPSVPPKVVREWWRQNYKAQQLPYPKQIGPIPPEVKEAFEATHSVTTALLKVAAEEHTAAGVGA